MQYNYKYRLNPSEALCEELRHHVDTCRQLYNHVLYLLNESDEIPARYKVQGRLPDLKSWWDGLRDIHSKVLQMVVKRVYDNLSTLKAQKENGRAVGILKYAHDTDGYAIESPDFSDERERLERAQRDLSRKEHDSANWEK